VNTTTRIREPVVTVLLSLGCPPRASHKFVSLLDPPLPAVIRGDARPRPGAASPATPSATAAPPTAVASAPAADVSTAATPSDLDERTADRLQLQSLEERYEQLRQDHQATQQSLAALQSKWREVEAARHDPALY